MKMSLKVDAQGMSAWKLRQRVGQTTVFSRHEDVRVVIKEVRHKIAEK